MSDAFPGAPSATVTRLERDAVPAEIVDRLRAGAIVAPADVGVIDLIGPGQGAITCFQGLLTSDIEKPGDGAFVYGALLTPKGTIVVAPFVFQVTVAAEQLVSVQGRLVDAGAHAAAPEALELTRILAGWPRLASEVDEKTIPQEVRFDEIGGVSYTKGCYTGQETVSRLHFRGHPNRHLRGLLFETDPPAAPASGWSAVTHEERDVGRVSSIAWLPDGGGSVLGRWIGLAIVRREGPVGPTVRAAGREARVVGLPFDAPHVAPA